MIARIVPIDTGWMLSGTQRTLNASQRAGVLQVAAERAAKNPQLEALLRKHKPWCFEANPLPPVTPLSNELAEALPSSR